MKKSTAKIIDRFPMLEKHIPSQDSIMLKGDVLERLSDTEQTFLQLLWFFEDPKQHDFNLANVYKYVDESWLPFCLECIHVFFKQDTYLMKEQDFSIIEEGESYLNQSEFADFLNQYREQHGRKFSRAAISMEMKRHKLPRPDATVGNAKYWKKETCVQYLNNLLPDGQMVYS